MSPFRAVPGRVPWKTRPPDARLRAPSLGLAPGRGPGDPRPGEGDSGPTVVFVMSESSATLCLDPLLKPVCHG